MLPPGFFYIIHSVHIRDFKTIQTNNAWGTSKPTFPPINVEFNHIKRCKPKCAQVDICLEKTLLKLSSSLGICLNRFEISNKHRMENIKKLAVAFVLNHDCNYGFLRSQFRVNFLLSFESKHKKCSENFSKPST